MNGVEPKAGAADAWRRYETPALLAADTTIEADARRRMLEDWQTEIDNRLNAEAEGLSAEDPLPANAESRLSAELAAVRSALRALDDA